MNPHVGLVVDGRYRLTERIAVGGMGEVWAAHDEALDREVALKILKPELAGNEEFRTRFRQEARTMASLSHPNIANVYDFGDTDDAAYLVMELVPGEPMNAVLSRSGPLPVRRTMDLLAQAARGLSAAHAAGVVHRDVKPGNLLVTPDGTVKVTDFGIARAGGQVPLTRTGQVMGTAQYLAPEQAIGEPAVPSSDVYALGVIGFEALTGGLPFTGESPVVIATAHVNQPAPPLPTDLPQSVRALIGSTLAKDPAGRPADAATFARAAEAIVAGRDEEVLALVPPVTAATQVFSPSTAAAAGAAPAAGSGTGVLPTVAGAGAAPIGRPRRTLTVPLLALIVLVAAAVLGTMIASGVFGSGDDTPEPVPTTAPTLTEPEPEPSTTTTSPTQTETEAPTTSPTTDADRVTIDRSTYLGRPVTDVVNELEHLGMVVRQEAERQTNRPRGEVLGVSPSGQLDRGDVVTVVYADPPATPTTTDPPSPTTSPSPSLTATDPPVTIPTDPATPGVDGPGAGRPGTERTVR